MSDKPMFTPGPWKIVAPRINEPDGVNGAKIWGAKDAPVCNIPRRADRPLDQKKADLHLIAAAPEMYEALTAVLTDDGLLDVIAGVGEGEPPFMLKVRAALAKAVRP